MRDKTKGLSAATGAVLAIVLTVALSATAAIANADEPDDLRAGSVVHMVAQAIASVTTPEGWVWQPSEDGAAAVIVGYIGKSAEPSVPANIDGKPVVGVIAKMSTGSPALTDIDLGGVSSTLQKLQVRDCALTSLDLSECGKLSFLDVGGNSLATLKVPDSLVELRCPGNALRALDVSACASLEKLDCSGNDLFSLDISACGPLYYLDCHGNRLTSLKCGANLNLGDLFCYGNYLSEDTSTLVARYGSDSGVVLPQNAGDWRIDLSPASVSAAGQTYTGAELAPAPTVNLSGSSLGAGDFSVAYENNVNAGTATVIVTGKGNFKGSAKGSFAIAKAPNAASVAKTSLKKKIKRKVLKKKAQTVVLPAVTSSFGTAKWSVATKDKKKVLSLSGNKVKVKKKAKKGAYTIKLKAMVPETPNYASASTETVTVKVTVK